MNIFYLNNDPRQCAIETCDKHVVKMVLESAQLLSTAHRVLDVVVDETIYKSTHKNHPSAIWCRQTDKNYSWLFKLFIELMNEYEYRYERSHACWKLVPLLKNKPKAIAYGDFTEPTPAMPDEYKVPNNSILSYHNYYNGSKRSFATWTNRPVPLWFKI